MSSIETRGFSEFVTRVRQRSKPIRRPRPPNRSKTECGCRYMFDSSRRNSQPIRKISFGKKRHKFTRSSASRQRCSVSIRSSEKITRASRAKAPNARIADRCGESDWDVRRRFLINRDSVVEVTAHQLQN